MPSARLWKGGGPSELLRHRGCDIAVHGTFRNGQAVSGWPTSKMDDNGNVGNDFVQHVDR